MFFARCRGRGVEGRPQEFARRRFHGKEWKGGKSNKKKPWAGCFPFFETVVPQMAHKYLLSQAMEKHKLWKRLLETALRLTVSKKREGTSGNAHGLKTGSGAAEGETAGRT